MPKTILLSTGEYWQLIKLYLFSVERECLGRDHPDKPKGQIYSWEEGCPVILAKLQRPIHQVLFFSLSIGKGYSTCGVITSGYVHNQPQLKRPIYVLPRPDPLVWKLEVFGHF